MALRFLIAGLLLGACTGSAAGTFHVDGEGAAFQMRPNTCKRELGLSTGVIDLYRFDPKDDTELVLWDQGDLYVRLPGRGLMVRLEREDCRVYDVDEHPNGVQVNDVDGIAGHVALDCERPELGHLVGRATFTCYP
jgi:hypothetical protein